MQQYIGYTLEGKAGSTVEGVTVQLTDIGPGSMGGEVTAAPGSLKTFHVGLLVEWVIPLEPVARVAWEQDLLSIWTPNPPSP